MILTIIIAPVSAARRHVRRCAAATVIQRKWRGAVAKRSFYKTRKNILLIQSTIRMLSAMSRVKKLRAKLEEASNYNSKDYYLYSKKRTSASIKIQAAYRMYTLRKKFNAHKLRIEKKVAELKNQEKFEKHLERYVKRLNQVSGKITKAQTPETVDTEDTGVEIDLKQHKEACPTMGKKSPIQSINKSNLATYDFETSKQRQLAAIKIQKSYRSHMCRTSGGSNSKINVGMVPFRCASPSVDLAAQILECSCWFQQ